MKGISSFIARKVQKKNSCLGGEKDEMKWSEISTKMFEALNHEIIFQLLAFSFT